LSTAFRARLRSKGSNRVLRRLLANGERKV
jgi:hypothetical protein